MAVLFNMTTYGTSLIFQFFYTLFNVGYIKNSLLFFFPTFSERESSFFFVTFLCFMFYFMVLKK